MQIDFVPLFSGSSGNALYLRSGETRILVDAGVSASRVSAELEKLGVEAGMLDAIVITHEHSDHISGVGVMSRRHKIPIYATNGTWEAMRGKLGKLDSVNSRIVEPDGDFYIGDIAVTPFAIPHDAAEPVGYTFSSRGFKASVATDMGRVFDGLYDRLEGSDIVLLESNHDIEMLKAGRYPYELKRRILGRNGHLSNDDAALAAVGIAQRGVKNIVLGHLSGENNYPELAYKTVMIALEACDVADEVNVSVANRNGISQCYHFET